MLKFTYAALSVALLVALMLCLERPAYAYVDPGSGLLVWQSAGTIFTGMIFYFRRRVKRMFRRQQSQSKDNSSTR